MKNKILICILLASFVQMATNGISAILGSIQSYYADVSTSTIQFLMTFPSLFIIVFTLLSAYLLRYFSKKKMMECGLLLVCISGIVSFAGYRSLIVLYIGAGLLGMGSGLCGSFAISLISDYFEENERQKIMGYQTAASNFGSMLMTFIGGLLATISWQYNYFVYFIALPGLICIHFWLDDKKSESVSQGSIKECGYSLKVGLFIILFMVFFYIGPTSIALALQEKGYESTSLAGYGASIFLLGGVVLAAVFPYVEKYLKRYCIASGVFVLAIGLFIMHFAGSIILFYIGCFLAGSSISFVMPQCMFMVSTHEKSENVSMGTAICMAASNVGTLIAPAFTIICGGLTTSGRLKAAAIICAVIGCLVTGKVKKDER